MSNEQVKELVSRLTPNAPTVTQHPMVVADDSPLTVYLDGDTTNAVQAVSLTGETLTVGGAGVAYWAPPLPPIVFLTTGGDPADPVDITYEAGFSSANGGQLTYYRIGRQVYLDGGANKDAGNYTTTAEIVAIIPATDVNGNALRPARTQRFANYGTGGRLGRVQIATNGEISIAAPNLVSSTDEVFGWLGLSHSYLTD